MTTPTTEASATPTADHTLFGEVRRIEAKVDELQNADTAILSGIEILNKKLDLVVDLLGEIVAREIRIEHEVSPPQAVKLVLSFGTTVPQ